MRESVVVEESDLQIVSVFFRLDSNYDNYSRRVYSFGDLLGQTGGLYSAVFILGGVAISIFSKRLFVSSILRKIYQIDEIRDKEVRKSIIERKEKNIVIPQNQVSTYNNVKDNILNTLDNINDINDTNIKAINKRRVIEALKDFIFSRKVFKYGYADIIQYLAC